MSPACLSQEQEITANMAILHRFRPERYLDGKMDGKAVFAPFGSGSRTCLGIHLAYMELRLAAATFFRECAGVKLADVTTPESMEIVQYFLIAPKAQRCLVALR